MADNTGRRNSRTRAVAHSAEHPASLSISEVIDTSALAVPIAIDDGHSTTRKSLSVPGYARRASDRVLPEPHHRRPPRIRSGGHRWRDAYFFGETAAEASGGARNILSIGGSVGAMPTTDNRTSRLSRQPTKSRSRAPCPSAGAGVAALGR